MQQAAESQTLARPPSALVRLLAALTRPAPAVLRPDSSPAENVQRDPSANASRARRVLPPAFIDELRGKTD